jgi:hypothetical protein
MVRAHALELALAGLAVVTACSYDFDQYIASDEPTSGGASGAAASAGGTSGGVSGGSASGGATTGGGEIGEGGQIGEGGDTATPEANGGAGGSAGSEGFPEGGQIGEGGAGGNAATSSGGTAGNPATGGKNGAGAGGSSGGTGPSGGAGQGGGSGVDCAKVSGTLFEGRCYFVVGDGAGLAWPAARSQCPATLAGSHLVTITSAAEAQFVETTFFPATSDRWIGLSVADTTGNPPNRCRTEPSTCPFVWVTGEALAFTEWGAHSASDAEPNYSGACVRIQFEPLDWADLGCNSALPAICESS